MPKVLSKYYLWLGRCIRYLYFSHIHVGGEAVSSHPTLFIASHRNGAIDGFVYMQALGNTPSLISIQLLRTWFMRLFFTGIAVVRQKDCQRYGMSPQQVKSPVLASIEQIQAGGCLCIYPEGTSEWAHKPLSYQKGMAVIVKKLKEKKVDFVVQPVGVFYTKPDGFRSRASLIVGKAFLPSGETAKDIQKELAHALDAVSVNCDSEMQFNAIQHHAWQACQRGQDFGMAFLEAQQSGSYTTAAIPDISPQYRWAKWLLVLAFPLTVFAAKIAERGSDGRNNLSFFRLLGAAVGSVLQLIVWLIVLFYLPVTALLWLFAGVVGWLFYPEPYPINL